MVKLKALRQAAGLSVQKLATLSGVPLRTIQDIEARGDCRISTAFALCQALGCRLDDFYTPENEKAGN